MILANHGAALGAQDEDGWSVAHYAADTGRKELLASAIRGGAPMDVANADGDTAASLAAAELGSEAATAPAAPRPPLRMRG